MKNISLAKIIIALCISSVYVFNCGVVGTVGSPAAPEEESPAVYEELPEEEYHGQGTIDFFVPDEAQTETVVIEQLSFAQPPLADRPIQSVFISSDKDYAEPEEILDVNSEESEETVSSEEEEILVIPEETEPEQTTAVPVTTTTATTTTTTTATTPSTTAMTATSPVPVNTTTTITTTTTVPTGGIRVDDEPEEVPPTTTTVATLPQQPTEITTDTDAANEILYVSNGGVVVSGTALDIVSRVTQNEIGYTFAPEAIKAQAVASYTYIKYCNKYGSNPSVILSDSVNDSVRTLVASVIGQAVYYDGNYIQAVYSASSAGYTASSANVWGNTYPYLSSVYCELDAKYDPNYGRTATFSSADIKERVYSKTGIELSGDPSGWFSIDSKVDGKYVEQLNVGGYHSYTDSDGKTVKISGRVFRERIMSYDLRSAAFDISYDAGSDLFTFTTYGYGHGVGMSQNGANNLATYWGWDYKQILEFYYSGASVY